MAWQEFESYVEVKQPVHITGSFKLNINMIHGLDKLKVNSMVFISSIP